MKNQVIIAVGIASLLGVTVLRGAQLTLQPHYMNRVSFEVEADALIRGGEHSGEVQEGESLVAELGNTPEGTRRIYLRFDLSEAGADYLVEPGFLRVVKDDWRRHDLEIWVIAGAGSGDWDPATITWDNAPAGGDSMDSLVTDPAAAIHAVSLGTWTAEETAGGTSTEVVFPVPMDPRFVDDGHLTLAITGRHLGVNDSDNRSFHIKRGKSHLTLFPKREETREPAALYLSWQRDPLTTMTIQWHTRGEVAEGGVAFSYLDDEELTTVPSRSHPMAFSDRFVHTTELTGLDPDTDYRFRIKNVEEGLNSQFYKFRTMPESPDRPIRIAVGGDVRMSRDLMEEVNRQVMRFDPEFIVWGGDLAYSDGREDFLYREYEFFDVMMETLITKGGRVVPTLTAIGNHEVYLGRSYFRQEGGVEAYKDTDEYRERIAPYFYNLFAFPGHPGYGLLDFGDYMTWVFLDSDHSGPIEGRQTEWLTEQLRERTNVPHLIPIYHVPAYPSVRNYTGRASTSIRQHWVPLFEEAGVRVAFENHDHSYKRTVPILRGQEDPDGIVYIGDGAWGVPPRPVHDAAEVWYLERAESMLHFILLTIHGKSQDIKVFNNKGEIIDHHASRLWATPADLSDVSSRNVEMQNR